MFSMSCASEVEGGQSTFIFVRRKAVNCLSLGMFSYKFIIPSYLLIFTSVTHFVTGVVINSVRLTNGLPYVRSSEPAHITFNVTLENGENLTSVVWVKVGEEGHYKWSQDMTSQSGFFDGIVNTTVGNGSLVFPSVNLSYAGNYTLTVNSNLKSVSTIYKLIVYYSSGDSLFHAPPSSQKISCKWNIRFSVPKMAPYPNITCSFHREDVIVEEVHHLPLTAITKIRETITDLGNGFYSYDLEADAPIQDIPLESFFWCYNWIEDSSISLIGIRISSIMEQPCPDPPKNLTYKMVDGDESCRGGFIPHTKLKYYCAGDINPHKTVECAKHGIWKEGETEVTWPDCKNQGVQFHEKNFKLLQVITAIVVVYQSVIK